jgi:hypothetical protein
MLMVNAPSQACCRVESSRDLAADIHEIHSTCLFQYPPSMRAEGMHIDGKFRCDVIRSHAGADEIRHPFFLHCQSIIEISSKQCDCHRRKDPLLPLRH